MADTRSDDRIALVLEGGGMRGIYTAGVIDVLLEQGLDQRFYVVWGVSAGATNASTVKARMIGRTCRDYLAFRDDDRFMSMKSFARTGNVAGAAFIYAGLQYARDPLDFATFNANPMRCMAVLSDVTFGTAAYLEISELPRDTERVRASASLPVLSEIVELEGHRYLDGGICDSVPVEVALGEQPGVGVPADLPPADRAVVVLTQHRAYVKSHKYKLMPAAKLLYAGYPYFLEALETRGQRYNAQREHIWELEEQGRAFVVAPAHPVQLDMTERDGGKLLDLYIAGRQEITMLLPQLRAFLGL